MSDAPPFYPEESLERHGIMPDDFGSAGCYALSLDTPDFAIRFKELWDTEYDVDPPHGLAEAISWGRRLLYVGATGCLRDRLHDHVAGDVRRVKLLSICPPTELVGVWTYSDYDTAEENERSHAYALRDDAAVWVNGELV